MSASSPPGWTEKTEKTGKAGFGLPVGRRLLIAWSTNISACGQDKDQEQRPSFQFSGTAAPSQSCLPVAL